MKITKGRAQFLKGLIGFTALILAAGPPLFGIGLALTLVHSDRNELINEYNYNASLYDGTDVFDMAGTINGVMAESKTIPQDIVGRLDDILDFPSTVVRAKIPFPSDPLHRDVHVQLNTVEEFTRFSIHTNGVRSSYAYCDKEFCDYADILDYCHTKYGPYAQVIGPEDLACERGLCHQCQHLKHITDFCVIVKPNPDTSSAYKYIEDPTHSCYYPFSADTYNFVSTEGSVEPTELTVTIRKEDDPYLTIQRLTEGTMNFGRYKLGEQGAGFGLLAAGIAMTVFELILFYRIWSRYLDAMDDQKAARAAARKERKANASRRSTPKEAAGESAAANCPTEQNEYKED